MKRVAAEIRALGGAAHGAQAALEIDDQVIALSQAAVEALGGVDILINNAGIYANSTWEASTSEGWRAMYQANVVSATELIRRLVPGMRKRGWGRVIQISSGEATNPFATMPDYAATKATLVNLTVSLAQGAGPQRINGANYRIDGGSTAVVS